MICVEKGKVNKRNPCSGMLDKNNCEMQVLASRLEHGVSKTAEVLEHSHWRRNWKRILKAASISFHKPILQKISPYCLCNFSIFLTSPKEKHPGSSQAEVTLKHT
ncbi:hypothetical protein NPIL_653641 [Nephila pilipes]|uniref:Uncharacterized protein n=1 Tax=Nephila pilipes TaxID=299642 RepID=A0A8X6QUZ2_NEPPI|nr:hypothetical protein NPIL_653641 [Nephila pilipes]